MASNQLSFNRLFDESFRYLDVVEGNSGVVSVDPNKRDRLTVDGHLLPENTTRAVGDRIDNETLNGWKREDFRAALRGARKNIGGFNTMPINQQVAAISFVYQNGEFFSRKHPKTANLLRQGRLFEAGREFSKASDGISPALWTRQIQAPRMANDLVNLTGFQVGRDQ